MKYKVFLVFTIISLFSTGCSINHPVKDDYAQYLNKNSNKTSFPVTDVDAQYKLTPNTLDNKYEFRSALAGYANKWVVEFGQILDTTLQSSDVQHAFKRLEKNTSNNPNALLVFDLENYSFTDFGAKVALKVTYQRDNSTVFEKTYRASGITQGGKMFWGGAFGMKNAIQQSTKSAIDQILIELINDLKSQDHNN